MGAAARMVQQWADSVKALFCSLHGHTLKALAAFSFAMCRCGHCHSGQLAASVVSAARPASSQRRWERLLAGGSWDGRAALAELAGSIFRHWVGRRVLLVLDETPGRGDLRSMRLGVAYRKRLLTVDARCYPKHRPPLFMPRLICQMLRQVAAAMPAGVAVTFLCDRGLAWPSVMDCVRDWAGTTCCGCRRAPRSSCPTGGSCRPGTWSDAAAGGGRGRRRSSRRPAGGTPA